MDALHDRDVLRLFLVIWIRVPSDPDVWLDSKLVVFELSYFVRSKTSMDIQREPWSARLRSLFFLSRSLSLVVID